MLFSFLWVAIEKFAYLQWFDPFLDSNEFLTMGLPRDFFLMCAAFVEFTLVYVFGSEPDDHRWRRLLR